MADTLAASLIAVAALAVLLTLSRRADRRWRHRDRLPMQWRLDGRVGWSAPRRVALAITPALAAIVLVAAVLSTALLDPHPGQDGTAVPAVALLALVLVGVHMLHLWLIGRLSSGGADGPYSR